MPSVYVIRANFGKYSTSFIRGGYVGIGWLPAVDLTLIKTREDLSSIFERERRTNTNNLDVERQIGQIERFLLEMREGDYVVTPDSNTETIHYGIVAPNPSYYYFSGSDGCPFPHRRKVKWNRLGIEENDFSLPFQHTIRSPLEVFQISPERNFLNMSGDTIWFQRK